MNVVLPPPAKITHPGREIGNSDEVITDPGVIHHVFTVHLTGLAFVARKHVVAGFICSVEIILKSHPASTAMVFHCQGKGEEINPVNSLH